MTLKVDPPYPDFMQNGLNKTEELTSKIMEPPAPIPVSETITEIPQGVPNYSIQSLFWLLSPKFKKEKDPNEADFCTVSFNIDFGNIRIELYNITKETAIQKHVLFLSEMDRLINATIYPGTCFQVANSETIDVLAMEQLINFTGEAWQTERPACRITKTKDETKLTLHDYVKNKTVFYILTEQQKVMFDYACKYAVTTGAQLVGMKKIKN